MHQTKGKYEDTAKLLWDDTAPPASPKVTNKIRGEFGDYAERHREDRYTPYMSYVKAVLNTADEAEPVYAVFESFEQKLKEPELRRKYSRHALEFAAIQKVVLGTTFPAVGVYDRNARDTRALEFTDLMVCSILQRRKEDAVSELNNLFQVLRSYKLKNTVDSHIADINKYATPIAAKAEDMLKEKANVSENMERLIDSLKDLTVRRQ